MKGFVHSIETMGALDGPGLRMIVFLQGCSLRCKFCHNPDTWKVGAGEEMTAEQICEAAKKYKRFFGKKGGVTFSGGEPLLQAQFVKVCIDRLHEQNIHCAVDYSGGIWNDEVRSALDACDLVLLDVKHTDAQAFRDLTGGDIATLRAALEHLERTQKPVWVRQVILEGYTQSEQQIRALLRQTAGIRREKIEYLPYHTLGAHKWAELGIPYPLQGVHPPSEEVIKRLRSIAE